MDDCEGRLRVGSVDARLFFTVARLAGTDDRLCRVAIDTAVPLIGGIWITFRERDGEPLTIWERHGAADLLTCETVGLLHAAARRRLKG